MVIAVGQPVVVFCRSTESWCRDGVVVEVLAEPSHVDGLKLPAGSVKVVYSNGESAKWVPPAAFGEEIREADFQVGDEVQVYVRSKGLWVSDGAVVEALAEAGVVDEQDMPAGSIKVVYDSKESAKWVPPEMFGLEVRAKRTVIAEDAKQLIFDAPGVPSQSSRAAPVAAPQAAADAPAVGSDCEFIISTVAGAARVAAGQYKKVGEHNDMPKYKNSNGAIVFFDGWWRLNFVDNTQCWCYEVKSARTGEVPMGTWQCAPFYRNLAHLPLEVKRTTCSEVLSVSGGVGKAAVANGSYQPCSTHNDHPKFKNESGAIVFFDGFWKLNTKDDAMTWCFHNRGAFGSVPPSGTWPAHRVIGADHPPVVVKCFLKDEAPH